MRESAQLELLGEFAQIYADLPFTAQPDPARRYHYENGNFSYSDAIMLACMIRHSNAQQLVEVGSGFSSCLTLDVNELFMRGAMSLTFIEPFPALLHSLLRPQEVAGLCILAQPVQDVALSTFSGLRRGDILFIDSSHVAKIGSDVNHLVFTVLPALQSGVLVHFHDIFFPFEYPQAWLAEGRAWNEAYLLRAFLQYNAQFEVVLMNNFMAHRHADFFARHMPLCLRNTGGSLWLRKK